MDEKIRQDICIGSNIRTLRLKAHLTQKQVVARLNEHGIASCQGIYSRMESGRYNIRVAELVAFSEIFGVHDFNDFFKDVELGKTDSIPITER